jgi:hypothetical protein
VAHIDFSSILAINQDEPPHIHIEREDNIAKFWLYPIRLQKSGGFSRDEINRIQRLIQENQEHLIRSWNEFFGS